MIHVLRSGLLLTVTLTAAVGQTPTRLSFSHAAMGTEFVIVMFTDDVAAGDRAAAAAFARIDALDTILSDYLPMSEVSRLARTAGLGSATAVSDDLWAVLWQSRRWSVRTGGAFDVTVGPLSRLGRWSARRGIRPPPERLAEARAAVGVEQLVLDPASHTVRLVGPKMRLDFGGIGKGYAADEALAVLRDHGVTRALIDAGGDLVIGGAPPGKAGWRVAIPALADGTLGTRVVALKETAVATSGDQFRHVWVDGRRVSHIVDPDQGTGLTERRIVTVVSGRGTDADALATAVSVLGRARGLTLLADLPEAGGQLIIFEQDRWMQVATPGFPGLSRGTN